MQRDDEIIHLQLSLQAIKQRLIQDLEALESRLARMAPDEAPTGIPSNPAQRKKFYRDQLSKI
ncbi:hypothetical protein [uncultured Desulfosarcina sp.]|uniref:hypothetical protein n=1 Tax=uncultured Desulfosarcina sp. TaxID=218289 RepID=UPI0029C94FA0|nr:hypothetical protein [uncultured Desulfosarcina sp.]